MPDTEYSHSDGHLADLAAAESISTTKDVLTNLAVIGNRQGDSFNALERSIENSKTVTGGLVTDSSFRTLEQFGLTGILIQKTSGDLSTQAEKLAAASDVQAEKLAAALNLQATINAKDGIIDSGKNAAASTLQAQNLAAVAALQAQNIAAIAAAAAAECCCEQRMDAEKTRQWVTLDGDKTRALIVDFERRNSDRRETDLKIELSDLKAANTIKSALLSAGIAIKV